MTLLERLLRAPEGASGGGAAPASGASPVDAKPGDAAPSGDAKAATAATKSDAKPITPPSILEGVKPAEAKPDGDAKADAKPGGEPAKTEETPEQKAEREKTEKAAAEKKASDTLKSYDALKLPEGMPLDQPAFVDFKAEAAKLGLTAESAQALVNTVAPRLKESLEAPYRQWGELQEQWIGEIKSDKEIGGKALDANLGMVVSAIHTLMPDQKEAQAVKEALAFTGAANNPAVLRLLFRAGKAFAEGKAVTGRAAPAQKPDLGAVFYPTMAREQSPT